MLLDLSPLRRHRDYRFLFVGQLVSSLGNFLTYVALPVQIYDVTKSSTTVGLLGVVQLVPVAATALWGGAFADAFDRRRLLRWAEALLFAGSVALAINAALPRPSVTVMFVMAGLMSAVSGFHTPALESLTPRLVDPDELPAVSALTSLRGTTAAIAGPSLAGACITAFGLPFAFALDAATFAISLVALWGVRSIPPDRSQSPGLSSVVEGIRYAASRPELIGTYVVDIVALTCAMPMALFPAIGAHWGGTRTVGYLYSAMTAGALVMTLLGGWIGSVERRGAGVVIAATAWGLAIVALGYATSLPLAILCLTLAGAADAASGLLRMTIWNETIPSSLRGRMAGIEQLSYMTGPLLGNVRAGFMAERFGVATSIVAGGALCVAGVLACIPILPALWRYRRTSPQPVTLRPTPEIPRGTDVRS